MVYSILRVVIPNFLQEKNLKQTSTRTFFNSNVYEALRDFIIS